MANGKLTNMQQIFADEYLKSWNATEAAINAGYSPKTARAQGSRLLTNVYIAAIIKERLNESAMSADETLQGLSDLATSDISDFVRVVGKIPVIDFEKAEQAGKLHLVKKISMSDGKITFELYDKQRALETMAKYHGLFVEKHEHSGAVEIVKGYATVSPDMWDGDGDS